MRTHAGWSALGLAGLIAVGSGCGGGGGSDPSSNADLAALTLSAGELSPAFAPDVGAYAVGPAGIGSALALTPTAADAAATIRVQGSLVASGVTSPPIALAVGANEVLVVVTAQNGTTERTYRLGVLRPSDNALLAGLTVSAGTLAPAFAPSTNAYGVGPALLPATVNLTPVASDAQATILVQGVPTASGTPSSAIALAAGPTPISILVTAVDGVTQATYTVVFERGGPAGQQAYIKASNTDTNDSFGGYGLALDGDTLVVGAVNEASNATGVNPGAAAEANDTANQAGAVYVFVRSGSTWTQQAYIKASNTDAADNFGFSVALSGDTLAVGAPMEDSNATGVNVGLTGESNNSSSGAGAVYVFVRSAGTWSQQAYIKASNTGTDDRFGFNVALAGDILAVGAINEDSSATGVNPGLAAEANNSALKSGAVYVFQRSGTNWAQQAYVKPSNTGAGDSFGGVVALSGETLVVGAGQEQSNATGVNAGAAAEANNALTNAGAVYVFTRSAGVWSQQAYVKASNTGAGDLFGSSLALRGDTLAVGAYAESSSASGVNPGPAAEASDAAPSAGAAYVFTRTAGIWSQQAYLKASNTQVGDAFGAGLGLLDDALVVGAVWEDSGATGVDPGATAQADNSSNNSGAAYVFTRSGATWSQSSYVKASNTGAGDAFGVTVAASGTGFAVGDGLEASSATGVNPGALAEADNAALYSGAVYVYR